MRDNPLPISPENSGEDLSKKVGANGKQGIRNSLVYHMACCFLRSVDNIHSIREFSHINSHHDRIRKYKQCSSLSNGKNTNSHLD